MKIKSKVNGLVASLDDGDNELLVVEDTDSKGSDNFIADSQEWLFELYKILKKCHELGAFKYLTGESVEEKVIEV